MRYSFSNQVSHFAVEPAICALANQLTRFEPVLDHSADLVGKYSGAMSSLYVDYELGKHDFKWW